MNAKKRNRHLLYDPIAIFLSIQIGIPLLIIVVCLYADAIETHPIISSVATVIVVCAFGILWFLRKISKS